MTGGGPRAIIANLPRLEQTEKSLPRHQPGVSLQASTLGVPPSGTEAQFDLSIAIRESASRIARTYFPCRGPLCLVPLLLSATRAVFRSQEERSKTARPYGFLARFASLGETIESLKRFAAGDDAPENWRIRAANVAG